MLPTETTRPKTNAAEFIVLIYGPTKIGKSTWCSKAPDALFLATEPGLNALEVYQIPISNWEQLLTACAEIAAGGHRFKSIVIDTVDNAYKLCAEYVCAKYGIDHESDLSYGKGWALVNNEFQRVLTKLALQPYGLFLVSHSQEKEIETRTGKFTKVVPTLPEKARRVLLGLVDIIAFCDLEAEVGADGQTFYKRVMRTKPHPSYEAGDRTGRLPETIPLDFGSFTKAMKAYVQAPKRESQPELQPTQKGEETCQDTPTTTGTESVTISRSSTEPTRQPNHRKRTMSSPTDSTKSPSRESSLPGRGKAGHPS